MATTVNAAPDAGGGTAAATGGTTGSPFNFGLGKVRTPAQLHAAAASQVDAALATDTAPLAGSIAEAQSKETGAVSDIGKMFGTILPFAAGATDQVRAGYDAAEQAQQGIMATATKRMNDLKQSRAQQAQALAQEMGGPVSVGEFTGSMGYEPEALTQLGAGQMLHTLGMGQADLAESADFSGRVLPLVQTEQEAQAKKYWEDKITDYQKQIDTLKATRGDKISSAYNDMLAQERQYQLNKAQQHLDEIKAGHDWAATKHTLANDDARLKIAQDQLGVQKAGQKYQLRKLTDAEKAEAFREGMSEKSYQLGVAKAAASTRLQEQRIQVGVKKSAAQYLDAAISPKPGKSVTLVHPVPVPKADAILAISLGNHNIFRDPKSKTGYSRTERTTHPVSVSHPITEPNALVDYLVGHNVSQSMAVAMVRSRLRIPSWKYGSADPRKPSKAGPPAPGKGEPGPTTPPPYTPGISP